jgi:hypothetical protein
MVWTKKTRVLFLVLGLIAFEAGAQTICNYKYRKRISFDPARVSGASDLSNFVALITIPSDNDLRTVANLGHVENANGFDIVFTSDDGVTLLSHQMQSYTATSGQYTAWVLIPSLSTSVNTYIYMYYGNAAIATDQSTTATWNNYYGVWHLENSMADNAGNNHTLTNSGSTDLNPAYIERGRTCSGNFMEVNAGTGFPNITTNFTISGWAYTTNNTLAGQRIFCDDENNSGGYALSINDNGGTGTIRFYSRGSSTIILDAPNNTIPNNTWCYCVGVADITNGLKYIYVNGTLVASGTFSGWGTDPGDASLAGETAAGETGNRLNGRIDEVRVARTALSGDFIATEYNNQSSPSTFYSISAEPKVWTGGTSTAWATTGNWLGGLVPSAGDDVIINNGSFQPTLSVASLQLSSLWIRSGATLSLSSNAMSIRFDVTNCGTLNGGTGLLTMNSTSSHIQNQSISGGGTYNLNNFTVNNTFTTSPSVTLNRNVSVSGALTLTSGIVYTTATNLLALSSTATSNSGSAASFVSGPMSKTGTTDFIFPVGKGTRWRRCSVTSLSASATFVAEYFNTPYSNIVSVNAPLSNVSALEYWQIDRSAGTGNARLGLFWESASGSGITNCPDLSIARWNGTGWDERAATTAGGAGCSGGGTGSVVTNAVVTAFSPFTFASHTFAVNPLPVELLSFNAVYNNGKVDLTWETASETNNDYFVVERSADASSFHDVLTTDGAGTTITHLSYAECDFSPLPGVSYYRLRQHDFNGDVSYSAIVPVNYSFGNDGITVFPNPAETGANVSVQLNFISAQPVLVVIRDVTGREFYSKLVISSSGDDLIAIDPEQKLAAGVYLVVATSDNKIYSRKLMIR